MKTDKLLDKALGKIQVKMTSTMDRHSRMFGSIVIILIFLSLVVPVIMEGIKNIAF